MVVRSRQTPFVGRERELGILLGHLEAAGQGQGRVVLLGGEPGIGKTRLALELAGRARSRGWQVLVGHAYESEGMPPYLPFVEALGEYVRTCPIDDLQAQLGRGAPEVARLIPAVYERLPAMPASLPLSPEHERYRLFESVCDFLLAIPQFGESRGLLLVLDDLQWADKSTLLLVQHLARRLERAPLLVLATHRSVGLDRSHPLADLLADLRREQLGEHLLLSPLAPAETAALIAAMTGVAPAAGVVEAIYRQTEGTPFFVGELVRHLQGDSRDLSEPQAAVGDWGVPEGVRQVVGRRLGRLSAAANRVLEVGAVLGDGFTFEILQATSESEPERLLDWLDEAAGAGMLREEAGGYHFSHDLIRQTVSGGLSGPRRQRLHLRAAEAIESVYQRNLGPHVAALAHHYRQAGAAGSSEKALSYARQAAEGAAAAFAWEEAASHLQTTLELLGPGSDEQRCELLFALGQALQRAGDLQMAIETFRQAAGIARALPAPEAFGRAVLGIVGLWGDRGIGGTEGVDRWVEEALSLLSEEDSLLRARLLARLAAELGARSGRERAEALSQEAVAMTRRIGDAATLGWTLTHRHFLLQTPEQLEERLAVANEMIRLAEQSGDRELALGGRHWRFIDVVELGDRAAFEVELPTIVRLAEELRQPFYLWLAILLQDMQALLEGRFDEAGRLAEQAVAVGPRARGAIATDFFRLQMANLRWLRGRREDMEAHLEAAGQIQLGPYPLSLRGCVYHELGDEAGARRVYDHALTARYGIPWMLGDPNSQPRAERLVHVARFCQLCACLGDGPRAAELYNRLRPYARHCFSSGAAAVCVGAFAHYLGLLAVTLGRFPEAAQHFEEAIEINDRLGARPLVADSRREYAAMLLRRRGPGDAERARELLEQALAVYAELGMEHWAAKAEALLAHPLLDASRARYPDGLTAREVEVLRLIAGGKSTREMAEALVISVATVERHITSLYGKIGARSRSHATAYAFRHRLLTAP